jgi:hypothetical protein
MYQKLKWKRRSKMAAATLSNTHLVNNAYLHDGLRHSRIGFCSLGDAIHSFSIWSPSLTSFDFCIIRAMMAYNSLVYWAFAVSIKFRRLINAACYAIYEPTNTVTMR